MLRFRAVLLWMLLLAVPFQGFAAASMVFCETASPISTATPARQHLDAHNHRDHVHDRAAPSDESHDATSDQTAGTGLKHICSTCAACANCHAVALPSIAVSAAFSMGPQADLAEPIHAIASIPPRVLKKPPRA